MSRRIGRYGIVFAAWLPFFAIWVLYAMSYAHYRLFAAVLTSLISMGTASLLGIAVWHVCRRYSWPLYLDLRFYLLQMLFGVAYSILWSGSVYSLEAVRRGAHPFAGILKWQLLPWQLVTGIWLYGLFAGVSYAAQTRSRLHEKEILAVRAQTLATAARLDAIRARLNPHFLFNALHTLGALVKFRPAAAEGAIEHLGDMLRYTLKEDGRELVEFGEEYEFTRQYLAFEQLRFEDRLRVAFQVDPESFSFDIPPFAIQTLAENAVHHAISLRPEGGAVWIECRCQNGVLTISVRDDGQRASRDAGDSHGFGLRSLQERLQAAYGPSCALDVQPGPNGYEVRFAVPSSTEAGLASASEGEPV